MAVGTSNLVRLFPDMSVTRSYWLVWHENQAVARRVQAVVELLEQILSEDRGMFLPTSEP
jgi:DNA-binding transcriptional LysR family regulator